jgi:hypothetical protein
MFQKRMDKNSVVISTKDELNANDYEYWQKASDKEKLQTITFLRECFYGKKATTGRLQRVYSISKIK